MQAVMIDGDGEEILASIADSGCDTNDELCIASMSLCYEACELRAGGVLPWIISEEDEPVVFAWTPELSAERRRAVRRMVDCRRV